MNKRTKIENTTLFILGFILMMLYFPTPYLFEYSPNKVIYIVIFATFKYALYSFVASLFLFGFKRIKPLFQENLDFWVILLIYLSIIVLFVFLQSNSFRDTLFYHLEMLCLCFVFCMALTANNNYFQRGMVCYFFIATVITTFLLIIRPNGMTEATPGLTFFGNRNGILLTAFPGVILSAYCDCEKSNKLGLLTISMVLLLLVCCILGGSKTSLVSLLAVICCYTILKLNNYHSRIISFLNCFLLSVVLTIFFVLIRKLAIVEGLITKVLHKSISLSGRTPLWDAGISIIKDSPLIGKGYSTDVVFGSLGSFHNFYLDALYYVGTIGLIIIILLIIIVSKRVDEYSSNRKINMVKSLTISAFLAYSITWSFEVYYKSAHGWILPLFIFYIALSPSSRIVRKYKKAL